MKRLCKARPPVLLALLPLCAGSCAAPELQRFEYEEPHMGTRFRLVLYAADAPAAESAAGAAFARLAELDGLLSDYDPESELSRLSARSAGGAPPEAIPVGDDLWRVLVRAQELAERSGGAFDVTVGPYVRLWRRAARQGALPSPERLADAAAAVGHAKLALEIEGRRVRLGAADMRLDLGGIAKGYALDEMLRVLSGRGVERALVDGGGDVAVSEPPPGRAGWRLAVPAPTGSGGEAGAGAGPVRLELARAAVATSGDTSRYAEIDGVRYSHLVDPATGLGLVRRIGATVVAPDGATADALASAACVLGPAAGLELVAGSPGCEARVVWLEGGALRARATDGFWGFGAYSSSPSK